ncbi:MAG TPA: type II secretion system protein [Phycisphaerales bacterium]|nr:type II secretion system protein [Phycisphaerales bacterium]
MDRRRGFTLIELLVVISIIALLMAILMPTLAKVRRQAKAVVCQQQLGQWGKMFMMYTMDNNGYFMRGCTGSTATAKFSDYWTNALRSYYSDKLDMNPKIRLCPMATKPRLDINGNATGARNPFAAWGIFPEDSSNYGFKKGDYGSYGINLYVSNQPPKLPPGADKVWFGLGAPATSDWRTPNVKNPNRVPLFLDCAHLQGYPQPFDNPPEYSGDQEWGKNLMKHFCQNRHDGYVNGVFLDFTVRKIGLKELWTLKWHRTYDINGIWTLAGGVTRAAWKAQGNGWMEKFKDY